MKSIARIVLDASAEAVNDLTQPETRWTPETVAAASALAVLETLAVEFDLSPNGWEGPDVASELRGIADRIRAGTT